MGDDAFFAAMRDWVAAHRFRITTGDRLLGLFRSRTDADLGPIFDAYLADHEVTRPRGPTHRPI